MKQCLALSAVAVLLAACGDNRSPEDVLRDASDQIERSEYQTALIQLKSHLQGSPQSGQARFLLGKTLFRLGDVAPATIELRKALELGAAPEQVVPVLAATLLAQGLFKDLIEEFGGRELGDTEAQAQLTTVVGSAHAALGDRKTAADLARAALTRVAGHGPATVLQAQMLAAEGELSTAIEQVDALLARQPTFVPGWLLKADLQWRGLRDAAAARTAYERAIELDPRSFQATAGLVGLLIESQQIDDAKLRFAKLVNLAPNAFFTRLFGTQLLYTERNFQAAREAAELLLRDYPGDTRVLQIAAVSEMRMNSLVKAESLLTRILLADPNQVLARYLLARLYNVTGQPGKAMETLRPVLTAAQPDATALSLAGEAQLVAGNYAEAESLYGRVLKLQPQAPSAMTVVGLGDLARGDQDAGFARLEEAAKLDPGIASNMVLIAERVRLRDFDGAVRAIDALRAKQPDSALPDLLRGQLHMQLGAPDAAAESFSRARQKEPRYFPALAGLVQIDLMKGDRAGARKRLEDERRAEPRSARVLMALAELSLGERASRDAVVPLLREAIAADIRDPAPRMALVGYLESIRDTKGSLAAAQEAITALPDHPEVLAALGRAQFVNAEAQQALATFNRLASVFPGSPLGHLRAAEVHLALSDRSAARNSLAKALEASPHHPQALSMLVALDIDQRRFDAALSTTRGHQRQRPSDAVGFALEGDVHAARGAWEPAAAAYRTALGKAPDAGTAYKLFAALRSGGRTRDAETFATGWQASPADQQAFMLLLGDDAILANDWPRAERLYRQVLDRSDKHARALNNLAMALVEQGRATDARAYAERALTLEAENPAYLDTMARVLLQDGKGDLPKALEFQQRAVALAEDNPHMRLQLARILIRADRRSEARAELERLTRLGGRFSEQPEVARLLASL